jgi:hypothetical protein
MKLQIEYTHSGTTATVVTLPADIIKWERYTNQKLTDLWKDDEMRIGAGDISVMIWAVLSRKQLTNEPFDIWVDNLESFDLDTDEVNPTEAEASSDSV